jgi:hypothetical protein
MLDSLLILLNFLRIQGIQVRNCELEIRNQRVAARLGEVFAHDDAQHLHLLAVRGHGVGGDNPAAFAKLMGAVRMLVLLDAIQRHGVCCQRRTRGQTVIAFPHALHSINGK